MNLTKPKIENYYRQKKSIYLNKSDLSNRFDDISRIVDDFIELDLSPYTNRISKFTSFDEDILEGNSKACYNNMIKKEPESKKHIEDSWKLIAGYDKNNPKDKYRIISNNFTKPDYNGNLHTTGDMSIRINGNFASNNYFFQIATFLQNAQNETTFNDLVNNSKMVLTWFGVKDLGGKNVTKQDAFNTSKELLKKRFPTKFLWMWANKDKVIHPISLMAFRNFLNTTYGKEILQATEKSYTPESITNMDFDKFKVAWKNISDNILEDFKIDNKTPAISGLSKFISIISIEETDIKNISDLLTTGNKAVILWGPPGTGKTFESMAVVEELLRIDRPSDQTIEERKKFDKMIERIHLFSNKGTARSTSVTNNIGYYEIVQFHPNYTYQDFIGGISPKLDGKDVSYELREGVFKKFCDQAKDNPKQKFIFIIDEINRAELSAVFGELLFALEYRGKHINLPHFKDSFSIPENVYIIGTMNNVDKSLVTFDLALRRRFGFFKLMPKLVVIEEVLGETVEEISLSKYYEKCKKLNDSIKDKLELGEDYQIGQAYFLKIKDFLNKDDKGELIKPAIITSFELEKLWVYNIEPLLEEYLGMSIEDTDIKTKLDDLKKFFVEDE